jgi:predicted nucleotidyltransferase
LFSTSSKAGIALDVCYRQTYNLFKKGYEMAVDQEIVDMVDIIKDTVPAERVYLFGSYAYGMPHENSDYDFYVVLSDDSIRPHDAIRQIHHALSDPQRRMPIDVLALSAERFDDRKQLLTLEKKVANEGILLYEQTGLDLRMA